MSKKLINYTTKKELDELTECPHCRSDYGFYLYQFVSGKITTRVSFDKNARTDIDNSDIYGLITHSKPQKTIYCAECFEKIGLLQFDYNPAIDFS